jgi:biotin transport system substrate-specific component
MGVIKMEISIENYFQKRYSLFAWRSNTSLVNKVIMAFFMACITGIMAQVIIPLPWTPVPITAQTFAVLMAGVVLGRWWGGISLLIYLTIGLLGVPWFAGLTGGYSIFLGSTGGYFIGFILAALFLGHFTDRYTESRNIHSMFALISLANFALIYIPGLLGLGLWIYMVEGNFPTVLTLISMGFLPFVLGDLVKIGGAVALTKVITPKEEY